MVWLSWLHLLNILGQFCNLHYSPYRSESKTPKRKCLNLLLRPKSEKEPEKLDGNRWSRRSSRCCSAWYGQRLSSTARCSPTGGPLCRPARGRSSIALLPPQPTPIMSKWQSSPTRSSWTGPPSLFRPNHSLSNWRSSSPTCTCAEPFTNLYFLSGPMLFSS